MIYYEYERAENDETEIDRWLRMMNEEEEENNGNNLPHLLNNDGVNASGRLTAPQNEVRKRQKGPKSSFNPSNPAKSDDGDDSVEQLRRKQIDLVSEQIKVQKMMFENAYLTQFELKERIRIAQIQAKSAELDLASKTNLFLI